MKRQRYVPLRRVRIPRLLMPLYFWWAHWQALKPTRAVAEDLEDAVPYHADARIQIVCITRDTGHDRIISAVRTDEEAAQFEREHLAQGLPGHVSWIEMPLQGSNGYHEQWPDPEVVYILSHGGLGDDPNDPDADATMIGVYTDREAAEEELRADDLERPGFWPAPIISPLPVGRRAQS